MNQPLLIDQHHTVGLHSFSRFPGVCIRTSILLLKKASRTIVLCCAANMISLLLSIALAASTVFALNSTTGKTCTIHSEYASSNGTFDDSPAIASAFADCASGGTVVFSEGK